MALRLAANRETQALDDDGRIAWRFNGLRLADES